MNHFVLSEEFDFPALLLLWKLKVTTTLALKIGTHTDATESAIYQRLLRLEKHKLIQTVNSSNGNGRLWTLGQKGFYAIRGRLPLLSEEGYKSEHISHDLACGAILFGDWIAGVPAGWKIFTDQELRRIDRDHHPDWVPNIHDRHRADGWWFSEKENRHLALEVELSAKKAADYQYLGDLYTDVINIERVIWLVRTNDTAYIHKHLLNGRSVGSSVHSFIFFEEFLKQVWQSQIRIGKDTGRTIENILHSQAMPNPFPGIGKVLLDVRKKPKITRGFDSATATVFF